MIRLSVDDGVPRVSKTIELSGGFILLKLPIWPVLICLVVLLGLVIMSDIFNITGIQYWLISSVLVVYCMLCFLGNTSKVIFKAVMMRFEFWFLHLNVVSFSLFKVINVVLNSDYYAKVRGYSSVVLVTDVVFWNTVYVVVMFPMLSFDSLALLNKRFRLMMVSGSAINMIVILVTSRNRSAQSEFCLFRCSDFDGVSLNSLLTALLFTLKFIGKLIVDDNKFVLIKSDINVSDAKQRNDVNL